MLAVVAAQVKAAQVEGLKVPGSPQGTMSG